MKELSILEVNYVAGASLGEDCAGIAGVLNIYGAAAAASYKAASIALAPVISYGGAFGAAASVIAPMAVFAPMLAIAPILNASPVIKKELISKYDHYFGNHD